MKAKYGVALQPDVPEQLQIMLGGYIFDVAGIYAMVASDVQLDGQFAELHLLPNPKAPKKTRLHDLPWQVNIPAHYIQAVFALQDGAPYFGFTTIGVRKASRNV